MGDGHKLSLHRFAVVSDIHSNEEAFRAVLQDVRDREIDTILCLGDIVGYGPDPKPCIDLVRRHCALTILGNHDEAVFIEPYFFNALALRAIHWTRDALLDAADPENPARLKFLHELPVRYEQDGMLFVHGSPRDPVNEYVTEADLLMGDVEKFREIFAAFQSLCFIGHTHVPGIFTESLKYYEPRRIANHIRFGGEKLIINTGSVGQPRDGNTKASYVEVDGADIHFRRVRYAHTTTMLKIKQHGSLHDHLGERLMAGV